MNGEIIKKISIVVGIAVTGAAGLTFAFTGPSQSPPNGNSYYWLLNGTNMYYSSGNVGIGTSTPSYVLHVNGGDIYASGYARAASQLCIGSSCRGSWGDIPSGAVAFFALSSCPSGWTATSTVQGRYIVGLPSAGTLGATVGTALSDQENRPVGQHTHTVTDPGHDHGTELRWGTTGAGYSMSTLDHAWPAMSTDVAYTGITLNAAGSVAGTNMPYIQLLGCQKN